MDDVLSGLSIHNYSQRRSMQASARVKRKVINLVLPPVISRQNGTANFPVNANNVNVLFYTLLANSLSAGV